MRSVKPIGIDAVEDREPMVAMRGPKAIVLPRPLRIFYRLFRRLFAGEVHIPNHFGSFATAGFLSLTLFYGAYTGGHLPQLLFGATNTAGLTASALTIEGAAQTKPEEISQALKLSQHRSLLGIDVADARAKLVALPWVKSATIIKNYPTMLKVSLEEREAFAVWKKDEQFFLVEQSGDVIVPVRDDAAFGHLPLILGEGAAQQSAAFLTALSEQPDLAMQVVQISRVADQRWDLVLANGVKLLLPDEGAMEAIALVSALDRQHQLLSRDIVAVDLRLKDRVALRLSPEAASDHAALIEARKRAEKRQEEGFAL